MSERVLLLGAGASYTNLIQASKRAGYEVVATDVDADAPGFEVADFAEAVDITDTEGILEVAKEYEVSGVIPINDYGVPTAAYVAEKMRLPGISPDVADSCIDKSALRRIWEKEGVPQPDFRVVTSLDEAEEAVSQIGVPVILKPTHSMGGSRGVSKVESRQEVKKAFNFASEAYDEHDEVLVEECVEGSEHSIEVLIGDEQKRVLVVSDKEKTPPPYRVDKNVIYPSEKPYRDEMERVALDSVGALGIDIGAAHVEMGVDDGEPKLFELGARCGGGATADPIVRGVTGMDYFANLTDIYAGKEVEHPDGAERNGVTYRFLTPDPGVVKEVIGIDQVSSWEGILDCQVWISEGDEIEEVKVGGDRSGSVVARADTREGAYRLAKEAEEEIEFMLE
jgi:biotin carboxylase